MATLWIRAYGLKSSIPVLLEPGTDLPLTYTGTSAASAEMPAGTSYARIISTVAFHYVVGSAPVATTSALLVPANTPVDIGIKAGDKIAAITA